ncbi:putative MFS transporter [Aspergillus alliaceus]|uniref:Putative MFS transporter n=1 Tax=Petromyces alliaceus TaxID=209559 RepID=A0A5N7C1J7_PETAA|nr:putative MFS transporter [Aspergillus alliaceus]
MRKSLTQTEAILLQRRASAIVIPPESAADDLPEEPKYPQEKWIYSKAFSAGVSFFVAGVNDGSLGSLTPYIIRSYNVDTNMVAILYGSTFLGWLFAALSNSTITQYLNLGPILCLGAGFQVIAHVLRVWTPPFPLYVITFFLASLGQAYNDAHANTYISSLRAGHRWLGFIHAMYMAGCLVGPFIATAVGSANSQWCLFYLFPLGIGLINLALVAVSFRDYMGPTPKKQLMAESSMSALKEIGYTLSKPGVWLLSLFFFFFLGATITSGGWMVEYLVQVRKGDVTEMGYIPSGFYGGAFLGRLLLPEPTHRLGERKMVFIYAVLCVGLQLVFWLVPNIITEAVAISLLGFFSGPFMVAGISVGSRIFSPEIKSSAIAFVFTFGQIGGSIFPAVTGIIAAQAGVEVLQPILVGLLGAAGISWLTIPMHGETHKD